ncbi:Orn/DAP/Arg decarboxylase 2 [Setomelanomma holmii]|uniref:Arginine decarboxylase n=1 Tax=Setomelanomma holmii TaxID=210430 RepID=A0A9P4H2R1_9PLEO|nr:Orn/DAP/Arg decarboxylase 2 [Setomelanomma holmii]
MYTFLLDNSSPLTPPADFYLRPADDGQNAFAGMILPRQQPPVHPPAGKGDDFDECEQNHEPYTLEFIVENDKLLWNEVPLMQLVEQYGTPLKLTYLPKISEQIQQAKSMFKSAMKRHNYRSKYTYCYPTKSSHFRFVLDEVLRNRVHLETSSTVDITIVEDLYRRGKISRSTYVVCNGNKQHQYTDRICELLENGFNVIPVLDSPRELGAYASLDNDTINIGIRVATDEPPGLSFRTSRLGVRYSEISTLYRTRIQNDTKFRLKMLHFFVDSGVRDSPYYWSEFSCFVYKYCELRKICVDLDSINIGGGLPIARSLNFSYDYEAIIDRIIELIASVCARHNVPVPHLFTEFGSYTVGESGAAIYEVTEQKQQNAKEAWCMIDGSFITQLPDTWATQQDFVCLPLNNWSSPQRKVMLGGMTCDSKDYYPTSDNISGVNLPEFDEDEQKQYVGLFHTGAYQEALGGYGGISHCLIPTPKHVLIDSNGKGGWTSHVFAPEQESGDMLRYLGYSSASNI